MWSGSWEIFPTKLSCVYVGVDVGVDVGASVHLWMVCADVVVVDKVTLCYD